MKRPEGIQGEENPAENHEVDEELHGAIREHDEWVKQLREKGVSDEGIKNAMAAGEDPVAKLAVNRGKTVAELLGGKEVNEENTDYLPVAEKKEKETSQLPRVEDHIIITKRTIKEGKTSRIKAGEITEGILRQEIRIGAQANLGTINTTSIHAMHREGDKIIIETRTSIIRD